MNKTQFTRTLLSSALFAITSCGLLLGATAQADVRFYPVVNLANNTGLSFSPAIATGPEDNVYVAWYDNTLGGNEILFSRSIDSGTTFSAYTNLSNNLGFSSFPSLATDNSGVVHIAWQDTEYGSSEILYARSADGGLTFSTPVNISNDAETSVKVELAVDGTNIYAVWVDDSGLWVARSTNSGATFGKTFQLAAAGFAPTSPQITVGANNRVHVVFQQGNGTTAQVNYMRSDDMGMTFSTPLGLSALANKSTNPSVAADKVGHVYVAWTDLAGTGEIFMSISSDGGASFAPRFNVTNNSGISIAPDLTVDAAGILYMVWQDTTPGNYEGMFTHSTNFGATFGGQINMAPSQLGSLITHVAADSKGNIFAVWDDNRFGTFDPVVAVGREGLPAVDNVSARPNPFSPNGDGKDDTAKFTASFTHELKWQLDIFDSKSRVMRNYRGTGVALDVTWDGKDKSGRLVVDGKYTYKISGSTTDATRAIPAEGNLTVTTVADDIAPLINTFVIDPTVFGPDGDGRRETVNVQADFNKSVNWVVSYRNQDGVEVFSQNGTGSNIIAQWDGKNYTGTWQPNGLYKVLLQATDSVGRTVSSELVITIDTIKPVISNIGFTPSTFSPNGDGIDDTTNLKFTLSEGALVTVYIYESSGGSLVRELYREPWYITNPIDINMRWDGLSGTGVAVAPGSYIFKIWARDFGANKAPEYPYLVTVTVK